VDNENRKSRSALAVNLGLAANVFLAGMKISVGILGHSQALLADGINSISDVAYYIVVWIFIRLSHKPADEEHPYGHSQLESIASLVVGAFVVTTGIAVFWYAVNNVFELLIGEVQSHGASILTFWVALFTVGVKIILYAFTWRLQKETDNPAILALAYDHRNDILSATAASIGILVGRIGYPWVDPLVGAVVALLILRTGVEILRQSSADLMDAVPSLALARQITELIKNISGLKSIEEIHAHRFGPYLVVNVTIGVDGSIRVAEGDIIASKVEDIICNSISLVRRVYVHFHPVSDEFQKEDLSTINAQKLHCRLE